MINTKRAQIRAAQRKEELNRLFAFKRRQLLEGKSAVFSNLYQRIEEERFQNEGVYLVKDLISCLHNHPQEENTYILIGNYLFDHKEALQWFITPLTDRTQPRYLENHMWTLYCGVQISLQFFTSTQNPCYVEHLHEFTLTATSIIAIMLDNLKRHKNSNEKDIQIWILFLNLLSAILDQKQADLPEETIHTFFEVLNTVKFDQNAMFGADKQLKSLWLCLKAMFRGNHDQTFAKDLLAVSSGIFELILKNLPYQRQECLELIVDLLSQVPGSFKAEVTSSKLINEMLYLMQQVPKLKPLIVNILKIFIVENTLDTILNFLNQGAHKLLSQALEWSLEQANENCLQDCLYCIYQIMTRLHDDKELRLLVRVQDEIQLFNFSRTIEYLWTKPQNERVNRLISLITDDFYSEESLQMV